MFFSIFSSKEKKLFSAIRKNDIDQVIDLLDELDLMPNGPKFHQRNELLNKEKFVTPVSKQFHHWVVALLSLFEVLQTF